MLKHRAANETATEMRGHLAATRHALLGIYVYMRVSEVTDDISKMAVELVQTLHRRTERQLERQILRDVSGVEGKINILYRIAEAVVANPNGTIHEVLVPVVPHETFTALAMESHDKRTWLRLLQQDVMRRKYVCHYRRMAPPIIEALRFQSDSRFQPVIKALEAIEQEIGSRRRHFRAPVPIERVVSPKWQEHAFEAVDGERKVNRHYYQLCVLEKLRRSLKCKEIWVEGSQAYRNPAEDLPTDWENSTRRLAHYEKLGQPLDPARFIDALRGRTTQALPDAPLETHQVRTALPSQEGNSRRVPESAGCPG